MKNKKHDKTGDNVLSATEKPASRHVIHIIGDDEAQSVSKQIWSHLGSQNIKLVHDDDMTSRDNSNPCFFQCICLGHFPRDEWLKLAENLDQKKVNVAITDHHDEELWFTFKAEGFSNIFTSQDMGRPEMAAMLSKYLEIAQFLEERALFETFKNALSVSPEALILFNAERNIIFISDHYRRRYPENAEKLIGMHVSDAFDLLSAESGVMPEHKEYQVLKDWWHKTEGHIETYVQEQWIRVEAAQLPGGEIIVTTKNITDYKMQQEKLAKQSVELSSHLKKEKLNSETYKNFVSMVSHEFRTPLTIIDGNSQIIQKRLDRLSNDDVLAKVHTIRNASSRLNIMIEDLLSANLLQSGNLTIRKENFDLGQLVHRLCRELEDVSKNTVITCDVGSLPGVVHMDKSYTTQIFSNLINNAIKYSGDAPEISIKGRADDNWYYISVRDNGIGIPEEDIEKIFDRFYRASTSSGIPGTGIGLSLTRSLVALHDGRIEIKSKVGRGSEFTVILPRLCPYK